MQTNSNLAFSSEENQSSMFDMLIEAKALSALQSIHLQSSPEKILMNIDFKIIQDYRIHSLSAIFSTIDNAIDVAKKLIHIHSDLNSEDRFEMEDWIDELETKARIENSVHLFAGSV